MTRFILPIILLGLAVGNFFIFTDPLINAPLEIDSPTPGKFNGGIKALAAKKTELDTALNNAHDLAKRIDELSAEYNQLPPAQLENLDKLLPDTIDNVQLIIDINNIATNHGMVVKNVKIKADDEKTKAAAISRAGSMEKGTVALSFSVTGSYDTFLRFLDDLARSLRIVDISTVNLGADQTGNYTYNVEVKTYWLK
jgi:Tfp pilus assembly protein PilO